MNVTPFLAGVFGIVLAASSAWAVELSKIDRRVAKEPHYKGKPRYCLIVFGPKAEKRVWLVLDGDVLYADRNGNGDLTDTDERVEQHKVSVPAPPGRLQFGVKGLKGADGQAADLNVFFDGLAASISWLPKGFPTFCGQDPSGRLRFANRPEDAPVIHFAGPLRLGFVEPPVFRRDGPGQDFTVFIGTRGLGPGTFAHFLWATGVPKDIQVTAEIEFPAKEPSGAPIKTKFVLLRGG
jgi:hypothetical protein